MADFSDTAGDKVDSEVWAMKIDEAKKTALETKAMLVESEYFSDVTYAIDREGNGMWVLIDSKVIAVSEPIILAQEMFEVWMHMKPKGA